MWCEIAHHCGFLRFAGRCSELVSDGPHWTKKTSRGGSRGLYLPQVRLSGMGRGGGWV